MIHYVRIVVRRPVVRIDATGRVVRLSVAAGSRPLQIVDGGTF